MAVCDFYKLSDVLKIFPELANHIPCKGSYQVGISRSGNIKYTNGIGILSISPNELPSDLYKRFYEYATGNTPPVRNIVTPLSSCAFISIADFNSLNTGIVITGCYDNLYIRNNSIVYYGLGKKKKLVERTVAFRNSKTEETVVEIIRDVVKHPEKLNDYRILLTEGRKNAQLYETTLKNDFAKLSRGLAKLDIEIDGPCMYFSVAPHYDFFTRLDKNNATEFQNWIKEISEKLIKSHNRSVKAKRFAVLHEYISVMLFKMMREKYHISGKVFKTEGNVNKCFKKTYKFETPDGITFSYDVNKEYGPQDNFVKEAIVNDLVSYETSSSGRTWCNKFVKDIFTEIVKAKHEVFNESCKRVSRFDGFICSEISNYNTALSPLMDGTHALKTQRKMYYDIKTNCLTSSFSLGDCVGLPDGSCTIKRSKEYLDALHMSSMKRRLDAIDYFESFHKDVRFTKGKGILNGETIVHIFDNDVGFSYVWKTLPYTESLTAWKKQTKNNFKEIDKQLVLKRKQKKEDEISSLGKFAGNFIAIDVAEFVNTNSKYITENATIHYLRGLANTFGGTITCTGKRGLYKPVSTEYVEDIIDDMIHSHIFTTKTLSGTYGDFDILKTTPKSELLAKGVYKPLSDKEVLKLLDSDDVIRDCYAEQIFSILKKKENKKLDDYMKILKLISSRGFVCRYYDEYVHILQETPDTFKNYLKMKKEMTEDNFEKKLLIATLKNVKKNTA